MINKIVRYQNNKNLLLYADKGILHARIDTKYGVKGSLRLKELVKDSGSAWWLADIIEVRSGGQRQRNVLTISPGVEIIDELPIQYEIGE